LPIAHSIYDPHMSSYDPESNVALCGLYNLLLTVGYLSSVEIYKLTILFQCLALSSALFSIIHSVYFDSLLMYILPSVETQASTTLNSNIHLNTHHKSSTPAPLRLLLAVHDATHLRLNFHIGPVIGFTSIL